MFYDNHQKNKTLKRIKYEIKSIESFFKYTQCQFSVQLIFTFFRSLIQCFYFLLQKISYYYKKLNFKHDDNKLLGKLGNVKIKLLEIEIEIKLLNILTFY